MKAQNLSRSGINKNFQHQPDGLKHASLILCNHNTTRSSFRAAKIAASLPAAPDPITASLVGGGHGNKGCFL